MSLLRCSFLYHIKFSMRICRLRKQNIRCYGKESVSTILGIETSCDDTGCAIVDTNGSLLGHSLYSQNLVHLRYGGINPYVAQELHRDNIEPAVYDTLQKASLTMDHIDAIAVTVKPGLLPSLKVGVTYANYLSRKFRKPLIPIHHMEAHALITRMYQKVEFPYLTLLISGGHCLLALVRGVDDFLLLGNSEDIAPGEAFDKVARRMKLRNIPEYSKIAGGKAVEAAAAKATDPNMFPFPVPLMRCRDCQFSFTGLKETLYRTLRAEEAKHSIIGDNVIPELYNLCAAFQLAIAEHLMHRTERAALFCMKKKLLPDHTKNLVISGGVACNNFIFRSLGILQDKLGFQIYRPPPEVCTDNGIMIAWNAIEKIHNGFELIEKNKEIEKKVIDPKASLGLDFREELRNAHIKLRVPRLKKVLLAKD